MYILGQLSIDSKLKPGILKINFKVHYHCTVSNQIDCYCVKEPYRTMHKSFDILVLF